MSGAGGHWRASGSCSSNREEGSMDFGRTRWIGGGAATDVAEESRSGFRICVPPAASLAPETDVASEAP